MQTKRYNITTTVGFTVDEDKDPENFLREKLKTLKTNLIFDNINIIGEKNIKDLAGNRAENENKND